MSSVIQWRTFSDSKKERKNWWHADKENQPSLKAYCFIFLPYKLWIKLLHRIWSGWNVISETNPYLLNVSFVSLILWALPSYFIVSGPGLWSCSKPWLATQTFALVWHTEGHGDTQKIWIDKRLLLLWLGLKANGVTSEFIVSHYIMGN